MRSACPTWGCRILYGVMNEVQGVWCERALRPLGGHGGGDAPGGHSRSTAWRAATLCATLTSSGFSLGYEMAYTNVLNMLDLAGLPLRSADRRDLTPLVVAGGTCCLQPGAPGPLYGPLRAWGRGRRSPWSTSPSTAGPGRRAGPRRSCLREAAQIPGIYVPSLYERDLPRRRHAGRHARPGGLRRAGAGAQAGGGGHGQVLFPGEDHRPLHGDRPRPGDAGAVPGLYPGLPVLSGGIRLPARSAAADPKQLAEYGKAACEDSGYQEMTLSSSVHQRLSRPAGACATTCWTTARPTGHRAVPALPAGGHLLHGSDGAAPAGAEGGASPSPRRRAPSACGTPSTRTCTEEDLLQILPHRLLRRLERA